MRKKLVPITDPIVTIVKTGDIVGGAEKNSNTVRRKDPARVLNAYTKEVRSPVWTVVSLFFGGLYAAPSAMSE